MPKYCDYLDISTNLRTVFPYCRLRNQNNMMALTMTILLRYKQAPCQALKIGTSFPFVPFLIATCQMTGQHFLHAIYQFLNIEWLANKSICARF
jgi:hypothetical protein